MTPRGDEGLEGLVLGVQAVRVAADDPEETMFVALTVKDLALYGLGAILVARLFPELAVDVAKTHNKITELIVAQEFLPGAEELLQEDDDNV